MNVNSQWYDRVKDTCVFEYMSGHRTRGLVKTTNKDFLIEKGSGE